MGSVVLVADETVAARRDVVYGLFGASHRERIGDNAAAGLWTAFGYFQQLPTAAARQAREDDPGQVTAARS